MAPANGSSSLPAGEPEPVPVNRTLAAQNHRWKGEELDAAAHST